MTNAARTFYRECLINKFKEINQDSRESAEKKHEHALNVMTQVRTRGYFFVHKQNDAWTIMTEAKILQKIKQGIRDCGKKRKAKPNQLPQLSRANKKSVTEIDKVIADI